MRLLLFFLLPVFCAGQSQQISFGVSFDTAGAIYLIRQLVTQKADTVNTTASAVKFTKAEAAIAVIDTLLSAIRRDSAEIQVMYRSVMRQMAELKNAAALIEKQSGRTKTPVKLTPEQEIARLREENERLKKQSETGKNR